MRRESLDKYIKVIRKSILEFETCSVIWEKREIAEIVGEGIRTLWDAGCHSDTMSMVEKELCRCAARNLQAVWGEVYGQWLLSRDQTMAV